MISTNNLIKLFQVILLTNSIEVFCSWLGTLVSCTVSLINKDIKPVRPPIFWEAYGRSHIVSLINKGIKPVRPSVQTGV